MQSLVFRPTEICRGPNIIQLIFTSLPLCSHLPPSLTLTFMALGYIRFSHKLFKMIYTNVAEAMHRELHWPGSNCYFRSTQESRQCKVGLEEGGGECALHRHICTSKPHAIDQIVSATPLHFEWDFPHGSLLAKHIQKLRWACKTSHVVLWIRATAC